MNFRQVCTFCFLQAMLWSLCSVAFFSASHFFTDILGLSFTFFFILGHIPVFAWGLGLIGLIIGLVGPRTRQTVLLLGGILFSFFLMADFVVFSQYHFHIGMSLLSMFFGSAGREIFVFSSGMYILIAVLVALIILVEVALLWIAKRVSFPRQILYLLSAGWFVCFLCYNGLYAWGKFNRITSVIGQVQILPFAYPMSANRRLTKWGFTPQENPYEILKEGSLSYPLSPLVCTAKKPTKNILIILIDSWRADTLTAQVMPQLSTWLKHPGMHTFTNHLSGGNSTMGGVFSLFYSLPHAYWDDVTAQQVDPLIIQQSLNQGYTPGIFASSQLTSPEFHRNVFRAIKNLRVGSAGNTSWERDENAVADFEQFLTMQDSKQPFFGFVFLDAPHAYTYPPYAKQFTPAKEINYLLLSNHTDPTPYVNQYKNAVYFVDGLINRILKDLQQRGLLENTLVLITADHGQELNDSHHNYWGHNGNFTDYQTKVPLVIYDSTQVGQQTLSHRTSHYDIAPTILQTIFGCTNPTTDYSLGQNLFDKTPRPFIVFSGHTERAVRIEDSITLFDNFGGISQYDNTLHPLTSSPDNAVLREGLKSFRRFYR